MTTTLNYLELPAAELDATKRFYSAAFGWELVDYGPTYAGTTNTAVEVGLNALAAPAPEHGPGEENGIGPLMLFGTDDLAAAERAVTDAGGSIVSAPYAYPGGQRFHFRDPSGNILGVYQSATDS